MIAEVLVKMLRILSITSVGGSIGNTFLMKYRYQYWQLVLKVLLTTLLCYYINILIIVINHDK